jgi:O-antigen/teichoic acid export membrane protein
MALRGWGVYALLVPTLVVPVVFAWDLWFRARWRPTWQWSWARFKPAWTFGTSRIAASSLTAAAGLIESSWLAALAGFAALGVFGRALALAQLVCGRIAKLLGMSVFPVLARIEARSPSYRRASAAWLRSVAWVVAPLAVLGAQVAEPLVRILYGPTWLGAAPLLPAALAAGAIGALVHTAYLLLLAQNGAKWCLIADSWRLAGTVVCLVVLAPIGLDRYLAGLAIVYAVSLSLLLVWLRRDEALSREGLRDAFVPPALAATAAGALSLLAGRLVVDLAGDWGTVAIHSVVVGATYVLVLRLAFEGALAELVSYMPERRRLGIVLRLNTDH